MLKETSQKYGQVDAIKNVITLDWLIANNMQVKFEIAGIQLKESEAKTLLSIGNEMPTVTVDLMDHVDSKLLDSSKLFNLSIEKKHPELASLAAKLAITTPELSEGLRTLATLDVREKLSMLDCPLLLLHGEKDHVTPPDRSRDIHRAVPAAHCILHPHEGHELILRDPAWVNRHIMAFISSAVPDRL